MCYAVKGANIGSSFVSVPKIVKRGKTQICKIFLDQSKNIFTFAQSLGCRRAALDVV
jgi:hypothetical protein